MLKIKIFIPKSKISSHICYSTPPPYPQPITTGTKTDLCMVLSTDMVGQLDVFRQYGFTLSMYSTQVGILQEAGQKVLGSLLQHLDWMHLEVQVMLPISLCYFMGQALKGSLTSQVLSTLLVLAYLVESHCPQQVPLGPL